MQRFIFLLPLSLAALVTAPGCSDDDAAQEPSLDRSSLTSELAQAHCKNIANCCVDVGIAYDADTCVDNATTRFNAGLAETEALEVTYKGTKAPDCVAAYGALTAKCGKITIEDLTAFTKACANLFVGTLKPGAACTESEECTGQNATCQKDWQDGEEPETGVCVTREARPRGKAGDDCSETCSGSGTFATCFVEETDEVKTGCYVTDKLWCDDGTCRPLGQVGDACTLYCAKGLFCDNGACTPLRKLGQPCAGSSACEDGTRCDGTECVAFKRAGVVCEENYECESRSCRNGVCALNDATEASCSGLDDDDVTE